MACHCHISKLPDHILREILLSLPIPSVLRHCRYVCRSWYNCLLDSYDLFSAKPQLSREPSSLFLCWCSSHRTMYSLECEGKSLHLNLLTKFSHSPSSKEFSLINSCKGLILINERQDDNHIYIVNPMTSEYMRLPTCEGGRDMQIVLCGLGFSHKTNQFKVVRVTYRKSGIQTRTLKDVDYWKAEVYCFGTSSSWRSTDGVVPQHCGARGEWSASFQPVLLNGSLYWHLMDENGDRIWAFDFESEQFTSISLPQPSERCTSYMVHIGVYRDSLYICYPMGFIYEAWLLKEDPDRLGSWSKLFCIDPYSIHSHSLPMVKILQNGDVLFFVNGLIRLYNPTNRNCITWMGCGSINFCAIDYRPNFISLKDAVGEEDSSKILNANSK